LGDFENVKRRINREKWKGGKFDIQGEKSLQKNN